MKLHLPDLGSEMVRKTRKASSAPVSEEGSAGKTADLFLTLAGKSKRARMMRDVEDFRSVPTIFSGFNRATQTGGAPISNVWVLHGPTGGGKTAFTCGIIRSFQAVGGLSLYVDAELAADTKKWFRRLGVDRNKCIYMGRSEAEAKKVPLSYEEIVEEVDGTISRFQKGKEDGLIPHGTPLLIVVDSISKMVPKSLLKKISEDGDAVRSGVGRIQAAMNTAWFLGLTPKVCDDDILFIGIAHEMENQGGDIFAQDYKVRGGQGIVYDAMMRIRVTYAGRASDYADDSEEKEKSPPVGKKHRVQIVKNKHGRDGESSFFYTSNGRGEAPMGFDRVREILNESMIREVIKGPAMKKGGWVKLTLGSRFEWDERKFSLADCYRKPELRGMLSDLSQELDRMLFEEVLDAQGQEGTQ